MKTLGLFSTSSQFEKFLDAKVIPYLDSTHLCLRPRVATPPGSDRAGSVFVGTKNVVTLKG